MKPDRTAVDLKHLRVLVIEDDETLCETMQFLLEGEGCSAMVANTGKQGIELARTRDVDLILCDVGLPDVGGWTVVKMIRKHNRKTPIYLVTAWRSQQVFEAGRPGLVNGVMHKPFTLEMFYGMLAEVRA